MLKNYLKTAFRNLSRNKAYAFLNILGLALGIGCALTIFKVVKFEKSFDTHHEHYSKIYRIVHHNIYPDKENKGMGTPHPVGPAIREDYPEVKNVVRTNYVWGDQMNVKEGKDFEKFLLEEGVVFTENSFFQMFDVVFTSGDPETALTEPNTMVITASHARKLFSLEEGNESEAMGKTINYGNKKDFQVVGVVADHPKTTNFPFHLLFEYGSQEGINPYYGEGKRWTSTSSNTNTWILVDEGFEVAAFNDKLVSMVEKYYDEDTWDKKKYYVQPLASIHSDDEYGNYVYATPVEVLTALSVVAIFLVLTACINFVNLATAQAANRSKEIGIRKSIGGYTGQLIVQFFSEVTLITCVSLFFSLAIAEFLFVMLEDVIGTRLQLELFTSPETIVFLVILLIMVSFLSGFYPSFLLSRMNTVKALKNKITAKNSSGGLNLRKALVVAQFAISQFLIIGTVIISAQMKYFLTKDLGFEKEAIIKTYLPERNEVKNERFRQMMMEDPAIANVTFALSSPTGNSNSTSNFNYAPLESADDYEASYKPADHEYIDLYGLELLAGRGIQKNDSNNYVVINRKAADLMGFKDNYAGALNERLTSGWRGRELKIVGVMDDFHSQDLGQDLEYVFLLRDPEIYYEIAFKTATGSDIRKSITHFEDTWEKVYPEYVIDWQFFDESLAENYEREESIASLMSTFSIVSIIIGCLGLYGLIAFIAANRKKEVGIRKVLGALVIGIIQKFSVEVFVLVAISFVIAAPLAYYMLNAWLNEFQFRIELGFGFFLIALLATLIIAALTVSHRTISTALINPATTLKDE